MNEAINKRDATIDILRCFAIIGIFIAHCQPNIFFIQLRSFDVILMVFLSAVCSSKFDKTDFNYFDYIGKRFMRLVLPVWIFLMVYFAGVYIFYYLPPVTEIFMSFAFLSDRYVWIIRILLILSLLAPLISSVSHKFPTPLTIIALITIYLLCELEFALINNKWVNLVLMTIPYGIVYVIGMNIKSFSKSQINILSTICFLVFLCIMILQIQATGNLVPTTKFKYPPQAYYMSYGLGITILLWGNRNYIDKFLQRLRISNAAQYIGKHTYWLYLWHIPFVDISENHFNPFIRFFIIFLGALLCVYMQEHIVKRYIPQPKIAAIFKG